MTPYLSHPQHAFTRGHYGQLNTAWHLAMHPEWHAENMPANSSYDLQVVYQDRQGGKLYECPIYTAWDTAHVYFDTFTPDWEIEVLYDAVVLQSYFYEQHNCPCHRKQDVRKLGCDVDDECEGDRFPVLRIYSPQHPELILYSELLDSDELNAMVEATRETH